MYIAIRQMAALCMQLFITDVDYSIHTPPPKKKIKQKHSSVIGLSCP